MEANKCHIEIDPDYEGNNAAIRNAELKEEQENELTREKLSKIIQEQFDKELSDRQQQIEEIEDRIFRAQKLLHVVRYVLISSYYNNKSLELNGQEEFELPNILSGQNRIHPAIKKLLGKNATNLPILSSRTKRKSDTKPQTLDTVSSVEPLAKRNKLKRRESETVTNNLKSENTNLVTNRLKTEHRIVVGNISYSKKSLEQEHLMHKWMVYIKIYKGCSKEGADLATKMMRKVVFYLHPSYKPHDVVEISDPPFHLSRRGWGEFPVRVQIFFRSDLNKPIDIIHNLKLDNTFMGRQTIGNETVVPIFLNEFESSPNCEETQSSPDSLPNGTGESSGFEHDYCFENFKKEVLETEEIPHEEHDYYLEENVVKSETVDVKIEPESDVDVINMDASISEESECNTSLLDHSYSLPQGVEKGESSKESFVVDNQPQTKLIYGLGNSYLDVNDNVKSPCSVTLKELLRDKPVVQTLITATGQQIRFLPQSFSKILLNNGSVVQVKVLRRPSSVLRKVDQAQVTNSKVVRENHFGDSKEKQIDREKYKLRLPSSGIKNMGEALPYLFERLPLWNGLAEDVDFKCTYPFVASSFEEYKKWHVGKKLSAEWSRAKTIKNLLRSARFCDQSTWSTKAIFMYGRSHCYTPSVKSFKIFQNDSLESRVLLNVFLDRGERKESTKYFEQNSHDIDIVSEGEASSLATRNSIDISDENLQKECTYVKESALDCGVILKPEPLAEGVTMNAAERMILEAVKCFASGLMRRARHHLVTQESFNDSTSEITSKEVTAAISERPEFRSITDFKRRRSEIDYFFMS